MKKFLLLSAALAASATVFAAAPVKVIFDTDMLTDFDDVGALACLHALADAGECEILATVSCTRGNCSVAAVEVINAYYGRPGIPVGCAKELGVEGEGPHGNGKATLAEGPHSKYVKLAKDYSRWVKHMNSDEAPDANLVYRRALAAAPDKSVVICSVGFITNLRRLLETKGDDISPLDGKALVAKKVKKWVAMACNYPTGAEYNSRFDWESSKIAFENWPTPIVFSDFQYGWDVYAGRAIAEMAGPRNPVKDIFKDNIPSRAEIAAKPGQYLTWAFGMAGRSAWDETAVLAAVRGEESYFNIHRGRYRMTDDRGNDMWEPDEANGPHIRLTEKLNKVEVGRIIDELICRGPGKDWKTAFRREGFDPDEKGASFFVVSSDIHVGQGGKNPCQRHLAEHVACWNSMNPRPRMFASLGDQANLNEYFGDRPTPEHAAQVADREYPILRTITAHLHPSVRQIYCIGNHDTYPGEKDRALWRKHFPDQNPYCSFGICGLNVLKLDGGGDGMIGAEQEKWIKETVAKFPRDRETVVLVHQPSVGSVGYERDIGRIAKEALGDRAGTSWLLAGHNHANRTKKWNLPSGGELVVATHCKDEAGWWAYGVKDGHIVARIFYNEKTAAFESGSMPGELESEGQIPVGLENRKDVLWSAFIGSPEERACRVKVENTGDNDGWFYYVGQLHYRFPKAGKAAAATRLMLIGKQYGKRYKWTPAPVLLSSDEKTWTEAKRIFSDENFNIYEIPAALVGAKTLSMRYEAWGMDCDDCVAGFALLSDPLPPKFAWRGFMLDTSRHFFTVEEVKKTLDLMAERRLNVFHWHLTDSEGWRAEIKRYPFLTSTGAVRRASTKRGTTMGMDAVDGEYGPYFYTQDQMREVVKYAADRGIAVVPEIEFPGHSAAAVRSYPFLKCDDFWNNGEFCLGKETTFEFYTNVLEEVLAIFPGKVIHTGGDECAKNGWRKCPKCQARIRELGLKDEHALQGWAVKRIAGYLERRGRRLMGWDELSSWDDLPRSVIVQSYRGAEYGIAAAKKGFDVVMSPDTFCYLDMVQGVKDDPGEYQPFGALVSVRKIAAFDPCAGVPEEFRRHILGGQGNLWAELVPDMKAVEWRIWPRLAALAEVLESGPAADADGFAFRMGRLSEAYVKRGINAAPVAPLFPVNAKPIDGAEWKTKAAEATPRFEFAKMLDNPLDWSVLQFSVTNKTDRYRRVFATWDRSIRGDGYRLKLNWDEISASASTTNGFKGVLRQLKYLARRKPNGVLEFDGGIVEKEGK